MVNEGNGSRYERAKVATKENPFTFILCKASALYGLRRSEKGENADESKDIASVAVELVEKLG